MKKPRPMWSLRGAACLMDCYFNSCIARMHFGQTFLPWKETTSFASSQKMQAGWYFFKMIEGPSM